MRRWVLPCLGLALALLTVGVIVGTGERRIATGEPVFLELAPVDPRAPLLGDYMALRYQVGVDAQNSAYTVPVTAPRGQLVVTLDARGAASFDRFAGADEEALAPGERLLAYRLVGDGVSVSSPSWFIPEGEGGVYAGAQYGEIRLQPDGRSILVGLRDENLQPLGTPLPHWQR